MRIISLAFVALVACGDPPNVGGTCTTATVWAVRTSRPASRRR